MKKVVSWVVSGIVILVIIAPALLFATGVIPYRVYAVHSGSMKPTMPLASAVIVRVDEPKQGQPISFYQHNEVITHRWIGTNKDGTLQTKGDANAKADPWELDRSEVIGGVTAVVPQLGYWILYLRNPATWGAGICLVIVFWAFSPLLASSESEKSEESEKDSSIQVA